jgi:uracil-DNA glycosylase
VSTSVQDKQTRLDQIKTDIVQDNICPDLAKAATHMVFGEGSPDAEIVFIGEAPGKNEDLQGRPFIGAAGKFLNEMLATIGLNREDVYITSILKYRPPNNRDPLPEEKAFFLPYMQAQLDVIQPKLVVTLGRHSTNCFLPDLQISKVHGQPQQYKSQVILPLYHPAAALYNGSMRQTIIDDFMSIPRIIQQIKKENK